MAVTFRHSADDCVFNLIKINKLKAHFNGLNLSFVFQISTLLFWFAQNVWYLYASRLLGGLFIVCFYVIGALYVSEIADQR